VESFVALLRHLPRIIAHARSGAQPAAFFFDQARAAARTTSGDELKPWAPGPYDIDPDLGTVLPAFLLLTVVPVLLTTLQSSANRGRRCSHCLMRLN